MTTEKFRNFTRSRPAGAPVVICARVQAYHCDLSVAALDHADLVEISSALLSR